MLHSFLAHHPPSAALRPSHLRLTLTVLPAVVQFTALALWYNVNDHKLDPRLTAPSQLLVAVLFIGVGQVSLMPQLRLAVTALLHENCTRLTSTLTMLTRPAAASQLQYIQSHWGAWGVLWNQGKMTPLRLVPCSSRLCLLLQRLLAAAGSQGALVHELPLQCGSPSTGRCCLHALRSAAVLQ